MATYLITIASITLANKACDILKSEGYACAVERTPKNFASGCGYSIRLKGNIEYAVSLIGSEHVGVGSDFDGIDTHEELPGAQSIGLLWDAMHKAGFTESQLEKIFCENVLRIYREIL